MVERLEASRAGSIRQVAWDAPPRVSATTTVVTCASIGAKMGKAGSMTGTTLIAVGAPTAVGATNFRRFAPSPNQIARRSATVAVAKKRLCIQSTGGGAQSL